MTSNRAGKQRLRSGRKHAWRPKAREKRARCAPFEVLQRKTMRINQDHPGSTKAIRPRSADQPHVDADRLVWTTLINIILILRNVTHGSPWETEAHALQISRILGGAGGARHCGAPARARPRVHLRARNYALSRALAYPRMLARARARPRARARAGARACALARAPACPHAGRTRARVCCGALLCCAALRRAMLCCIGRLARLSQALQAPPLRAPRHACDGRGVCSKP